MRDKFPMCKVVSHRTTFTSGTCHAMLTQSPPEEKRQVPPPRGCVSSEQGEGTDILLKFHIIVEEYYRKCMVMAPFIPVANVLQANVRFSLDGQQIENVLNFAYPAGDFSDSADVVWGILDINWWDALRETLSTDIVNVETYMVDLTSASGPTATYIAFSNPAGEVPVGAIPNNSALCVTHRTLARGRSFRGRSYISALPESIVTGSRVAGGNALVVSDAFNAMRVAASAAGTPFVIVSRYSGGLPRVAGVATPVSVSLVIDNVLDSQRRRLPGRGT